MVNWQLSREVSADQCQMIVSRLRYTTFGGDVFFNAIGRPVFGFQSIAGSGPFLKEEFSLLSAYGKS